MEEPRINIQDLQVKTFQGGLDYCRLKPI